VKGTVLALPSFSTSGLRELHLRMLEELLNCWILEKICVRFPLPSGIKIFEKAILDPLVERGGCR